MPITDLHFDILSVLLTYLDKVDILVINNCSDIINHCNYYAQYGYVDILKWISNNKYILFPDDIWISALRNGQIEVLQFLHDINYDFGHLLCYYTAIYNQLDVLKWARANGYSWNESVYSYAFRHGHNDIVEWARNNGCPI